MAHAATCSHRGTRYRTNQDAACVLAADTCRGELAMAIVCDGVGGLASGELASATVTERFCRWFEHRLPLFLQEDAYRDKDGLSGVEDEWRALLLRINADLVAYGKRHGCMLGTTFSGVFAAPGRYVALHVGDCRILRLDGSRVVQVSEEQTLLALKLDRGDLACAEDAAPSDASTLLQAVGTQANLAPVVYRGSLSSADLLVVCCDGAWRRVGNDGLFGAFSKGSYTDEEQLASACAEVVRSGLALGETDNITVACLSGDLAAARGGETR